ncbi:hypothetical protein SY83_00295 [Paenibacillus swuensis]|uniref:Uncharacterized protein n=1 Tax=Paenibacillus swuensis TaxID=1178515 RepID=A0A172TDF0_9BACL|nr:DUF5325 family protein [Paenibacillus swuensis]ANE45075.1 hypothetical protein SY83_00295 [Paenibacillus swuensis]
MSKSLSLFFAVLSTILLVGVGAALSFRNVWLVIGLIVAWVALLGYSFALKARLRRQQESEE